MLIAGRKSALTFRAKEASSHNRSTTVSAINLAGSTYAVSGFWARAPGIKPGSHFGDPKPFGHCKSEVGQRFGDNAGRPCLLVPQLRVPEYVFANLFDLAGVVVYLI
ncbi:MAG: hypothetical protein WD024_02040 [Bacillota bacterium]